MDTSVFLSIFDHNILFLVVKCSVQKPSKILTNTNPGNVLVRARKIRMELAKELQNEDPPEVIKNNLAKVRAERQAEAKERLLRPRAVS